MARVPADFDIPGGHGGGACNSRRRDEPPSTHREPSSTSLRSSSRSSHTSRSLAYNSRYLSGRAASHTHLAPPISTLLHRPRAFARRPRILARRLRALKRRPFTTTTNPRTPLNPALLPPLGRLQRPLQQSSRYLLLLLGRRHTLGNSPFSHPLPSPPLHISHLPP